MRTPIYAVSEGVHELASIVSSRALIRVPLMSAALLARPECKLHQIGQSGIGQTFAWPRLVALGPQRVRGNSRSYLLSVVRDNFPLKVQRTLAARVAHRCSDPGCRAPTTGPQTKDGGSV